MKKRVFAHAAGENRITRFLIGVLLCSFSCTRTAVLPESEVIDRAHSRLRRDVDVTQFNTTIELVGDQYRVMLARKVAVQGGVIELWYVANTGEYVRGTIYQ